ncbi:MAG: OadG family protein [Anaerolineae bacterium]|nr:OadG family protein [Anaerolineae bacterium]
MWNIDWNVVAQGAQLTVVGMGLVFLALSLVVLSMVILTRLPWLQAREKEEISKSANQEISKSANRRGRAGTSGGHRCSPGVE